MKLYSFNEILKIQPFPIYFSHHTESFIYKAIKKEGSSHCCIKFQPLSKHSNTSPTHLLPDDVVTYILQPKVKMRFLGYK